MPVSHLPPPQPYGFNGTELGAGLTVPRSAYSGGGMLWAVQQRKQNAVGVQLSYVREHNLQHGWRAFYRRSIVDTEGGFVGWEGEVGGMHLRTSLPLAWRHKKIQISTGPGVMLLPDTHFMGTVPIGLSCWPTEHWSVHAELSNLISITDAIDGQVNYRWFPSLGLGYRW